MGGQLDNGVSLDTSDNFHRVYSVTPVHLPQINNTCVNKRGCVLHTITVTENIYDILNDFDSGFSPIAASEMKVKMVSR